MYRRGFEIKRIKKNINGGIYQMANDEKKPDKVPLKDKTGRRKYIDKMERLEPWPSPPPPPPPKPKKNE